MVAGYHADADTGRFAFLDGFLDLAPRRILYPYHSQHGQVLREAQQVPRWIELARVEVALGDTHRAQPPAAME